jgi:hypothetical protein
VRGDRHAESDHGRSGAGSGYRAQAPPGVELGHYRVAEPALDGGPLHVHRDVPGTGAEAEEEQSGRHRGDAGVTDGDGSQAGGRGQRHHDDGAGFPDPPDDEPG